MLESAAPASLSQVTNSRATSCAVSEDVRERLYQFLLPLLTVLDAQIDVRLVRTLWQTVEAMIRFRNRAHGLLLSELGGYLLSPEQAPAGTKRLSNLLRCARWAPEIIDRFLWQQAKSRHEVLAQAGKTALLLWDESVIEKPESLAAEGLCAVRSAKTARLRRLKPSFYTPPAGPPTYVPGLNWVGLVLLGMAGPPTVAAMRWFSTRGVGRQGEGGKDATDGRKVQYDLLKQCTHTFGRTVLHVFDRGYAGAPWLSALAQHKARFLVRWPKRYKLLSPARQGEEVPAWKIPFGQATWDERQIWDARKRRFVPVGVLACNVQHPEERGALWLVVARRGKGQEPWYLLTSEPVTSVEEAWKIVLAYARRYQIEMTFRFGKSELALESPRLWTWERRLKLMLIATLAYAFLLTLLDPPLLWLKQWLLEHFCHRTGKRAKEADAPLYRLRDALAQLWQQYRENPELDANNPRLNLTQSSG